MLYGLALTGVALNLKHDIMIFINTEERKS